MDKLLKKLGDDSKSYRNIFNGMYDKPQDDNGVDNPVCRLCLNYVVGRGFSDRYEDIHCCEKNDKNGLMIPMCDKCAEDIREEYGKYYNNYDTYFYAIGKKYFINSWARGNT